MKIKNTRKSNLTTESRFAESLGGEEYDDLLLALDFYQEFQEASGDALREYVKEYCADQKEVLVLEAGPGTGITTLQILNADPRVVVVSVDNEPRMIDAIKDKFDASDNFNDRYKFILSDILEYLKDCPDDSFDAFVSVYTLHNFTSDFRRKVIKLISKKLKSGGIFINGDKYARKGKGHEDDLKSESYNYSKFNAEADKAKLAGDLEREKHLRQLDDDWVSHMWEDDTNKITVEEQNKMFADLEFKDVSWKKRFDLVITVTAIKK